jgi:formate dehydrogenase maturation protein FdhE
MDYLALAKEKVKELVDHIQLLSDEEKATIASFLISVNNNLKVSQKECFAVLNIHKKALRKSFKLHRQAKREYGVNNE